MNDMPDTPDVTAATPSSESTAAPKRRRTRKPVDDVAPGLDTGSAPALAASDDMTAALSPVALDPAAVVLAVPIEKKRRAPRSSIEQAAAEPLTGSPASVEASIEIVAAPARKPRAPRRSSAATVDAPVAEAVDLPDAAAPSDRVDMPSELAADTVA